MSTDWPDRIGKAFLVQLAWEELASEGLDVASEVERRERALEAYFTTSSIHEATWQSDDNGDFALFVFPAWAPPWPYSLWWTALTFRGEMDGTIRAERTRERGALYRHTARVVAVVKQDQLGWEKERLRKIMGRTRD